ncbi:hypothetical protein BLNAU_10332 [Blattamonas nauphoetae]|uniref:CCR4-NOT transcription complex subunit 10 n=1 Tax=Blattamonas nauphoetae TaxID=2049346 RepID=A0ABQ9XT65_9EUKA|nr:hypothetical protein BLNAU_10332 [Blattamonas nauphoetae]
MIPNNERLRKDLDKLVSEAKSLPAPIGTTIPQYAQSKTDYLCDSLSTSLNLLHTSLSSSSIEYHPMIMNNVGVVHLKCGQRSLAAFWFLQALKTSEKLLYSSQMKLEGSLPFYSAHEFGQRHTILYNLGKALFALGDYESAFFAYKESLIVSVDDPLVWCRLGECCELLCLKPANDGSISASTLICTDQDPIIIHQFPPTHILPELSGLSSLNEEQASLYLNSTRQHGGLFNLSLIQARAEESEELFLATVRNKIPLQSNPLQHTPIEFAKRGLQKQTGAVPMDGSLCEPHELQSVETIQKTFGADVMSTTPFINTPASATSHPPETIDTFDPVSKGTLSLSFAITCFKNASSICLQELEILQKQQRSPHRKPTAGRNETGLIFKQRYSKFSSIYHNARTHLAHCYLCVGEYRMCILTSQIFLEEIKQLPSYDPELKVLMMMYQAEAYSKFSRSDFAPRLLSSIPLPDIAASDRKRMERVVNGGPFSTALISKDERTTLISISSLPKQTQRQSINPPTYNPLVSHPHISLHSSSLSTAITSNRLILQSLHTNQANDQSLQAQQIPVTPLASHYSSLISLSRQKTIIKRDSDHKKIMGYSPLLTMNGTTEWGPLISIPSAIVDTFGDLPEEDENGSDEK